MKRNGIKLASTAVLAFLFLLTLGASRASATSVTYDFTSDHCSGGCGTPPLGSVVLTQSGTSVDVVVSLFDQSANPSYFVKTGAGDLYAFKFDASSSITSADITIDSPTNPLLSVAGPGSFDGDGTGNYTFGIICNSCGKGGAGKFAGPIEFTVANATISDLTIANNDHYFFTADILSGNGNTGPVASLGPVGPVPDGGMTLMLLGGSLVGLAALRRRFTA
jgi:hypothetical protein